MIQRVPELFPPLRPLLDRKPLPISEVMQERAAEGGSGRGGIKHQTEAESSQADSHKLSWRRKLDCTQHFRRQPDQRIEAVRPRDEQHDEHPRVRNVLLVRQVSVDRHETREARGSHQFEQTTIPNSGPSKGRDMTDLVRGEVPPKRSRDALVKQQSHETSRGNRRVPTPRPLGCG